MTKREASYIPEIQVNPMDMFIMDIERMLPSRWFFRFKPLDYTCIVTLSSYVIVRLLKWAISRGFIEINGTWQVCESMRKRRYNAASKEENAKKKSGASVPTRTKNS